MTNRELAEWMAFGGMLTLAGYIIRIILCELRHDQN